MVVTLTIDTMSLSVVLAISLTWRVNKALHDHICRSVSLTPHLLRCIHSWRTSRYKVIAVKNPHSLVAGRPQWKHLLMYLSEWTHQLQLECLNDKDHLLSLCDNIVIMSGIHYYVGCFRFQVRVHCFTKRIHHSYASRAKFWYRQV